MKQDDATGVSPRVRAMLTRTGWDDAGVVRMMQLSWAPIYAQERVGSGLNLVASVLAARLRTRGFRVAAIASGLTYRAFEGMGLVEDRVWRGCTCLDFVNSPNLATGNINFRNVAGQISAPEQTRMLVEFAKAARIEVAHVHSLEGYSFELIPALAAAGVRVVYTTHNYYGVCPQVDLNQCESRVCDDFDGGRACEGCLRAPDPKAERARRRRQQSVDGVLGVGVYTHVVTGARLGKAWVKRAFKSGALDATLDDANAVVETFGDKRVACTRADAALPLHIKEAEPHVPGRVKKLLRGDHHLRVLNDYGTRRVKAVEAMNAAAKILCPSRFVMDVHAAMGVDQLRLVLVPLGLPHVDRLRLMAREDAGADQMPWSVGDARPLRLAFFGTVHPNKGLVTLLRALLMLEPHERARLHVLVHASGGDEPLREWMKGVPEVAFLGAYSLGRIESAWREYDVGVFPNAGLDNSPLVVMEHLNAGKFTLVSDLGGPGELIREGENGMLVEASNPASWAKALRALIGGEVVVPSPNSVRAASALRGFEAFAHDVEVWLRRGES